MKSIVQRENRIYIVVLPLYGIYYDKLGQLVREDNTVIEKTYLYNYDLSGNITSVDKFELVPEGKNPVVPDNPCIPYDPVNFYIYYGRTQYTYGDSWGDKLTYYNGYGITYDEIGNPLSYCNGSSYTFTWSGRQMKTAKVYGLTYTFTYNDQGQRISKSYGNTTIQYYYDGDLLVMETDGNYTLVYLYDYAGSPVGMKYRTRWLPEGGWACYWYEKNLQGDIVGLYGDSGTKLVEYIYDAWGNPTVTYLDGSTVSDALAKNPFMYRGYYYDSDLKMYNLKTRYYDPAVKRFISADNSDVLTATPDALTDKNLYAYCDNNPVMRVDYGGEFWHIVVGAAIGALIGGVSSIVGQIVSGGEVNWAEVGISAASGALTGAITTAVPGMGAVATGVVHATVGAGAHAATELVNGRIPTVLGTLSAGVTSGILAFGAKAIGSAISSGKLEIGKIKGIRASKGYWGVRYKTNSGPAFSVELHGGHNGHSPHLQVNKWVYQFKGYEGQPYRFKSWHYEFFKLWKGVY